MIGKLYKHYKGGIYQIIGIANPIYDERIAILCELYCYGCCTETNKILNVYKDSHKNLWIYNYFDDNAIIYKDITGKFWIRPKSIFFENGRFIEIGNISNL